MARIGASPDAGPHLRFMPLTLPRIGSPIRSLTSATNRALLPHPLGISGSASCAVASRLLSHATCIVLHVSRYLVLSLAFKCCLSCLPFCYCFWRKATCSRHLDGLRERLMVFAPREETSPRCRLQQPGSRAFSASTEPNAYVNMASNSTNKWR